VTSRLDTKPSAADVSAGAGSREDDARRWRTPGGVEVARSRHAVGSATVLRVELESALDTRRGLLMVRGVDHAVGYVDPPVEIVVTGGRIVLRALNGRGRVLLPALREAVVGELEVDVDEPSEFGGRALAPAESFPEEERTRQVGVFRVLRALVGALAGPDRLLGLYGAFGYDLLFELEPISLRHERECGDHDLVLHLPDEIIEFDSGRDEAIRYRYEFVVAGTSTVGRNGGTAASAFVPGTPTASRDLAPGGYAAIVDEAMASFYAGDLFEVVPSQVFYRACVRTPAQLFRALLTSNPAPHSLLANLGAGEYLVGASPEMFVQVGTDAVVRTSPISGTVARGRDALQDAERIRELLNSSKDECELTMCTDVDRNDKSRVCVPGTVRVTGRREIVRYSKLIHTVDRVEGVLKPDRDALDAFLTHLWAVTVTGAPKLPAVQFIEDHERSPRRWYGGAVGHIGFDGSLDTVLTLRTMQIRDGIASVRAGATVLVDSVPAAEEAETELKASALLWVLDGSDTKPERTVAPGQAAEHGEVNVRDAEGSARRPAPRVLLVDHRDSFVHCLGDYLRQTGADVTTYRAGHHLRRLEAERPDLVVLSPGPGRPGDHGLAATISEAQRLGLAVFGVCLGLQGLVEHAGGRLHMLARPVHGKCSTIEVIAGDSRLFAGLPRRLEVGRYHSLAVTPAMLPDSLRAVAVTHDGIVMAVEHRTLPIAAVQFHPESIMTADGQVGRRIIDNVMAAFIRQPQGVPS